MGIPGNETGENVSTTQGPYRLSFLAPLIVTFVFGALVSVGSRRTGVGYVFVACSLLTIGWVVAWIIVELIARVDQGLAALLCRVWNVGVWPALVALLLVMPVISRDVGDPPRRAQCYGNLRAIAIAFDEYRSRYHCVPPAFIADETGRPMHSWRVLILPCFHDTETDAIYRQYRFDEPWDSANNRLVTAKAPRVYRCPSGSDRDLTVTSYAMVVGRKAFSRETASLPGLDVGARTHSKIAVAEVSGIEIHWAAPRDLLVTEMVFAISAERGPCIGSNHIGGANALLSSGEVVFLSQSLNAQDLRAMVGAEKDATAE